MNQVHYAKVKVEIGCDQVVRLQQIAESFTLHFGEEFTLSRALRLALRLGIGGAEKMIADHNPRTGFGGKNGQLPE